VRIKPRRVIVLIGCLPVVLFLCVTVALAGMLLRRQPADPNPTKNPIAYGLSLMPSGFDPYINASPQMGMVLRSVYDTLLYRDPQTRQFVPGLATQTEVAPDGLTYTFKLRTDVKFHDGTPFNAQAVAHTLDRITNADLRSQKAVFLLGSYDHYTIVDAYTIQLVLRQPYAPLLDGLCQFYLGIASPTALDTYDASRYQFHQVGTGPFEMVEYIPGDHLTLRRNPAYKWGPAFYHVPTDHAVDQVTFRFYANAATRAPALSAGEAQIIDALPPTDAGLLAGNSNLKLYPEPIAGTPLQFFFNVSQPPTDKLDIRQALIVATNRAAIVDSIYQQFSPVANAPLSATTPYALKTSQPIYPFDAAKALQLLGSEGYSLVTGDKTLSRNGQSIHLVMVVPPQDNHPQIAQQIQQQWREIGIDVELRQVANYATLINAQKAGDYNLIAADDSGIDADMLSHFYGSGSTPNWTHYVDTDLDGLFTQASSIIDPIKRGDLYTQAQQKVMDQALVLPISDTVIVSAASARIGGLTFDAYGWYPLLANLTFG